MKKALLPLFWILAIVGIFQLANAFNRKSEHFFGLADNREQNISFEYPVEIIQTLAVEGENVNQGMTILEVRRNDLASNQATLDEKIRKLELEKREADATVTSQIESLKAQKQSTLADIDQHIHEIEARIQLIQRNQQVAESISEVTLPKTAAVAETLEIQDLEKKRHYAAQAIQIEVDNLTKQLNATSRPIDAQIAELKNHKAELIRQNKSLQVAAQFNGRIGSIHFKPGDLVAAFQPVMTVHSVSPRSVKGYIHENILNEVQVNQTVWVRPIGRDHDAEPLEGVVESLGNRIVEYPERIKKDPLINAWGREVVVRLTGDISPKNSLLFGEKVDIFLEKKKPPFEWLNVIARATAGKTDSNKSVHLSALTTTNSDIDMKEIEASALLWNPKENHYLLVSDEQYDDEPGIFTMNKEGAITDRLALLDNTSIDDLESISTDGDYIYVSSSLSYNKKDELKPKRRKLLRFKYQQQKVLEQQEIDLFDVLSKVIADQPDSEVAHFLSEAITSHSIDIESHFVKDNAIYLGFKAPFIKDSAAAIIKLSNLDAIFKNQKASADIWQTIALKDPNTGEPTQLSDMLFLENRLILLSVSRTTTKNSHLWTYMLKDNTLKHEQHFPDVAAEGVTYRPDLSSLVIVFDEGKNAISKYRAIKLPDVTPSH